MPLYILGILDHLPKFQKSKICVKFATLKFDEVLLSPNEVSPEELGEAQRLQVLVAGEEAGAEAQDAEALDHVSSLIKPRVESAAAERSPSAERPPSSSERPLSPSVVAAMRLGGAGD